LTMDAAAEEVTSDGGACDDVMRAKSTVVDRARRPAVQVVRESHG